MHAGFEFRLLGSLDVLYDGVPVPIMAAKQRTLLACLLLNVNRAVSSETLIAQVWDEALPDDPRAALQSQIARLRRVLDHSPTDTTIQTRPEGYLLASREDALDLHRFRTALREARQEAGRGSPEHAAHLLTQALDLWRGEPLADVPSDLLRREVLVGLREERLAAATLRVEAYLQLGAYQDAILELTDLTAKNPLREELCADLMTALHRAGRQSEALDAYQRMRTRLADELGIDPGATLQQLHLTILRDSHTPDPTPPASPAPGPRSTPTLTAASTIPRQLPADIAHFSGRTDELTALDHWLAASRRNTSAPPLAALVGAGGIGKTSLAVHWAHQATADFPDGQLYLDVHGYARERATDPADALDVMLRALGVDATRIPDSTQQRAGLYRSVVAERRMLIVLDNARDAAQVRTLLPGAPGCVTLVTSRSQLRGLVTREGAFRLAVSRLPPQAAAALFAGLGDSGDAPLEPSAIAELVELCAGLPLAIRIIAERISRDDAERITEIISELRDHNARLDALDSGEDDADLRTVFSYSYRALDADAARLFRLLALYPGRDSFSLHAAAALSGLTPRHARDVLDRLVTAHLLEQPTATRYRFHDLLHEYSLERATDDELPGERAAAVERLLSWFLHTASRAQERLRPNPDPELPQVSPGVAPLEFDDYTDALSWFDDEWPGLYASIRLALHQDAATTAVAILWRLRNYLSIRAHWRECTEICEAARDLGDPQSRAQVMCLLGLAHFQEHRYAESLAACHQGLELITQSPDAPVRLNLLSLIGLIHMYRGDAAEAVRWLLVALDHPMADTAPILQNLGGAYGMLNQFDRALTYSERALEQHEQRGERADVARSLCNLAEAHLSLGDHDPAIQYCRRAVAVCQEIDNREGEATALVLLGRTLQAVGDDPGATAAMRRALAVLAEIGDTTSELAEQARKALAAK